MTRPHLTKSRYLAGLQCQRRMWLLVHRPPEWEEAPAGSPPAVGQEIGRKAHLLFPGGILVEEEPWRHADAVARTAALMADRAVSAIFEAAFEHAGIRIRADVLERLPDGSWGLREVKSSGGVKDHHIDDLALQAHVIRGAGVRLASVHLLHVDTGYVRGAGEICWRDFFAHADLTDDIGRLLADIPAHAEVMLDTLDRTDAPTAEPGHHCGWPVDCEFWGGCVADKPDDWIAFLPRLGEESRAALDAMGIKSIAAIPHDFPLSSRQAAIRDATSTGKPSVATELGLLLDGFGPPAHYLDFEVMMPAIPLYPGTRPYQAIPFQWSLHTLDADGALGHRAFLAAGDGDPRRAFAETLIEAVGTGEFPTVVYSSYEATRLNDLADHFPDLRPALHAIGTRLADLLPVVRNAVYHPDFGFSNSLKAVAPALCPRFGYEDLEEIADGMAASSAFAMLASGVIPPGEQAERMRRALLAYCRRDTLALVEVHRALAALAGHSSQR